MLLVSGLSGVSVRRPGGTALLDCPLEQTWGSAAPGVGALGMVCNLSAIMGHVLFTLGTAPQIPHFCSAPMCTAGSVTEHTGASQLELAYGVTGKLQTHKTMEHLGVSHVTSHWLEVSDY